MSEALRSLFQTLFEKHKYIVVDFNKVNGDKRVMTCSLDSSILPEQKVNSLSVQKREQSMNIMSVWDVHKKDWRAFRIDSVNMLSSRNPETGEETVQFIKDIK